MNHEMLFSLGTMFGFFNSKFNFLFHFISFIHITLLIDCFQLYHIITLSVTTMSMFQRKQDLINLSK